MIKGTLNYLSQKNNSLGNLKYRLCSQNFIFKFDPIKFLLQI